MAKFYGPGTGANRGYWFHQYRDGKGRWIEMGSIGRYVINGVTYTGKMVGGDGPDSINMERRTANGQPVEATIDKINPRDFENLNAKATLDVPEGFDDKDLERARRADKTRPTAAAYPNGTKVTAGDTEYTKADVDTWSDSQGNTLKNSDVDSALEQATDSSAEIPDEADLTAENILNATDGSSLTWKAKQYSRLDGKWFDEKTGKPVSDKTMRTKTDGDLSTEGGKEDFTPTPASEYETGSKLHAEMRDGDSTADLEKTDDNAWDVTTDESETPSQVDDATVDNVIEASDTLDDVTDSDAAPEEQSPDTERSLPQSGDDIAWEEEDASAFDQEVTFYEDAITNGYRAQVTKEKRAGERARWYTEVYDQEGNLAGESNSANQKKARDEAARIVREDSENNTADREEEAPTPETETPERVREPLRGPDAAEADRLARDAETPTEEPDAPETDDPEEAPETSRTAGDIIEDLDTSGGRAIDAISNGSDEELAEARAELLTAYQEAQTAIDDPSTPNADKVRLQSKVEEVDRAVTAIDQEIASRSDSETAPTPTPETETDAPTSEGEWVAVEASGGTTDAELVELGDGAALSVYRDDDDGQYYGGYYPPGSDDFTFAEGNYSSKEEARNAAQEAYESHDPSEGTRPASHSAEDLEGGHQADPQPVDESLSTPTVDQVISDTQEAAENGTLNVEDVDESADFTPTEDIEIRRTNAEMLANPQDGDVIVSASGRVSERIGGQWVVTESPSAAKTTDEAQKILNQSGPETFRVGRAGSETPEPPKGARTNKHDIDLKGANSPDHLQFTNEDGTQETYSKVKGRWHRRLDGEGNLSPQPTDPTMLHAKLNDSRQVATKTNGRPVTYYGEKELRPSAPAATTEDAPTPTPTPNAGGGLVPGAEHVPAVTPGKKPPLGSFITDKPAKTDPNKVLTQDGVRVGMSDADGNAYYIGDRVVYTDRSKNVRSARITAISDRGPNKKPAFDMALDEHDPSILDTSMPFDEWYAMTGKERTAAGMHPKKYSKTTSMYQDSLKGRMRLATDEDRRDSVQAEHDRIKEEGRVTGRNVAEPEILPDVSIDRVVRDGSTAIIGTTNKHGELFQRGEVVSYGPNGEVGTIVHIGEADNRIRIAPNGQSALESVYHHVDTISHSNKPASFYDENYDLPARDRVARDLFNNELRVGDTVYRGGFPFTVKDIYPDGSKIRVVGQDWAGEQGSAGSLSTDQLIDLGFDRETALEMGGAREHDFMPDHLQVFTGDVNDIKSVRTHDSHMMTVTRDSKGRVLDTPENRAALASRALGNKNNTKISNSALARYIAENGDQERYDRSGIQPGDTVDQGIDQAAGDNLQQYVNLTFGTDLVIPDNSKVLGYNKFGQYETYTKKNNRWHIEGVEGDDGMSAQEFYQYRLNNGYIPNPDGDGDPNQFRMRLSYLGDADDSVVPKPGTRIKKTDDEKFALMPIGSVVQFKDAEGNIITIRKGSDGQWYRATQSGAYASNRGAVDHRDVAGSATYRGVYSKNVPLPKSVDTTSEDAEKQNVSRQKREVSRNNKRRENGGVDRIYGTHITAEDTFREGVAGTEDVRESRRVNEQLAAERDALARENEAARERESALAAELERLKRQLGLSDDEGEGDETVTASLGNRIVATRKGTDHVLAVYNRVNENVWEYTSKSGIKREFTLDSLPSTPGITYKVEEHVA